MKITPLSLALVLAAAAVPSVTKADENVQRRGDEQARRQLTMPGATHVNVTTVTVVPDTNEVNVTVERTDGWPLDRFRIFVPNNDTDRTCTKGGYPDDAEVVSDDYIKVTKGNDPSPGSGNDEDVIYTLDVVEANLTSAPFWYSDDNSVGTIEMCIQADLMQNITGSPDVSVGYDVSKIKLDVDVSNSTFSLTAGATANNVTTSTEEFDNIYNVSAYLCPGTDDTSANKYDVPSTALTIEQNEKFSVCLVTSSTDVQIDSLTISSAKNALDRELVSYIGITDNTPNSDLVTLKKGPTGPVDNYARDTDNNKIVEAEFFALALMFDGPSPTLTFGGTCKLAFSVFEGRRLVEQRDVSIALRGLQGASGDDAGTAALELEINLAPTATDMADEDVSHNIFHENDKHGEEGPSEHIGAAGVNNNLETYSAASVDKKGFGFAAVVLAGAAALL